MTQARQVCPIKTRAGVKEPSVDIQDSQHQTHSVTMRRSTALATLALTLILWSATSSAAPRYDDEPKGLADRDVQMWRDSTMQILQQLLRSNGDFGPIYHRKRNSEIINSLLGLPKTMADAGR